MDDLDSIVRRMAEVTDELLALDDGDFARRFELKIERDELRAKAKVFHEGKDAKRTIFELQAELAERRRQLAELRKSKINMLYQAQNSAGGHTMAISREHGGTLNNALMKGQGSEQVFRRIAELEQELTRRGYDTTE
jgi:hypothetical protein